MKAQFSKFTSFNSAQIKWIEYFERLGWEFKDDFDVNPHNGNHEYECLFKSPRMNEFKDLGIFYCEQLKSKKQIFEMEARVMAGSWIIQNAYKIREIQDKIMSDYRHLAYKEFLKNSSIKSIDKLVKIK